MLRSTESVSGFMKAGSPRAVKPGLDEQPEPMRSMGIRSGDLERQGIGMSDSRRGSEGIGSPTHVDTNTRAALDGSYDTT
jgi:hypothetical protein